MKARGPMIIAGLLSGLVALFLVSISQNAEAVPSFARKYRTSCQTCHLAFPELNAFGRAFRNNGYRMPGGDQNYTKEKQVPMGAPAWKRVWPHAVWPADIPGGSVASFILESNYTVSSERVSNEFDGIDAIGLIFGGTAGESFSFFGDVDLFEGGQPGGIGRLFVQYNRPGGLFNFRVGEFEPRAVPFSSHRRLIRIAPYLVDILPTIPAQNFFGFSENQKGVEVYGSKEGPGNRGGLTWSFGVVNGEFGAAAESLEEVGPIGDLLDQLKEFKDQNGGEFDVNSRKDFYGSFSYKIGGMGVLGGGTSDSLTESDNWRDNSVTLGAYYYNGTSAAIQNLDTPDAVYNPNGNDFYRTGFKADIFYKDLNVFGVVQLNNDQFQFGPRKRFRNTLGMVEAHYVIYPWLIPAYRFENVNPSFGPAFQRHTFAASFLVRANAKLLLEFVKSQGPAPELPPFENKFRAGFNIAF